MHGEPCIVDVLAHTKNIKSDQLFFMAFEQLFTKASSCPNCLYPGNAGLFQDLHRRYRAAKIKLHHMKKRKEDIASQAELVARMRSKLVQIRPCPECRRKYNPTDRVAFQVEV